VSVYVWTALGPEVRGGLSYILLPVVPGCFHPEQKSWLAVAHSALLAAEVAVTGAYGKARSSPGLIPSSLGSCRGAERAEPQVSGQTYVPREVTLAQWGPDRRSPRGVFM
jgi:hypothetical protein